MIIEYKIGTLAGQYEPNVMHIQDSGFKLYRLVYWLINDQPNRDFTQDNNTSRATWNQTFNTGDTIICHFATY